ncbi:MAG: hypothetical protein NC452_14870 [Eubacterium sp.]|nr:hypothetical protein [Eubacterium sp.]
MTKLKKAVTSFVICVLMVSMLTFDVSAESVTFPMEGANITVTWTKTPTFVTVSAFSNTSGVAISVSVVGTYYVKGTTTIKTVSNGNVGTTGTTVSILNGDGTWISIYVNVNGVSLQL